MNNIKDDIINEQIPNREVLVIDENGNKIGTLARDGALRIAHNKGMDLVLVSPLDASPLVAKVMDNSKFRYEQQKKAKEAKKNQKVINIKEIQLSPVIQENDIQTKLRHAEKFLANGDHVKITLKLKGRMITRPDQAKDVITNFIERLSRISEPKGKLKLDERNLEVILIPKKNE
jgi:translation initiation factor IF-3